MPSTYPPDEMTFTDRPTAATAVGHDPGKHGTEPIVSRTTGRVVRPVGRQQTSQGLGEGISGERRVNISQAERKASVVAGGAMLALGLTRRTPGALLLAGLGGLVVYRGLTGHCSTYDLLGRDTAREDAPMPQDYQERGGHVEEAITVNRPAQELYDYWRDLTNLVKFMPHLKAITPLDDVRSRWVMHGPAGTTLEYDAEVINDDDGRLISWRSTGHADVNNAGSVRFVDAPGGRGTVVRMSIDYIPPVGGKFVAKVAHALGLDNAGSVRESLRRFKQLMEAGEIATTRGQSAGAGRSE